MLVDTEGRNQLRRALNRCFPDVICRRCPRGTHTMSNSRCLVTSSCARVFSSGRGEIRRIFMSALDGLQFSGSLAPCQAQLEELSAKLQQDRALGDVMGIAAVERGGASTKGLCRRIASPFQSIEFYGSVERGKMNVNSCLLAFSALRLLSINVPGITTSCARFLSRSPETLCSL